MTCVDLAKIMLYLGSCATVHSIFVNVPLLFFDFGSLSRIFVLPKSDTGSFFTKAMVGCSVQPKKVAKFSEIMLMAKFLSILTLHDLISSISSVHGMTLTRTHFLGYILLAQKPKK